MNTRNMNSEYSALIASHLRNYLLEDDKLPEIDVVSVNQNNDILFKINLIILKEKKSKYVVLTNNKLYLGTKKRDVDSDYQVIQFDDIEEILCCEITRNDIIIPEITPEQYQLLNTFLGESIKDEWYISDIYGNLVLIHYKDSDKLNNEISDCKIPSVNKIGDIRGLIIDISSETLIVKSYPYIPTFECDEIKQDDDKIFFHEEKNDHNKQDIDPSIYQKFDKNKVTYSLHYEGVILRMFLYQGQVYCATHRKIIPYLSRWGNSITFKTFYDQIITEEHLKILFEGYPNVKDSTLCHVFIGCHDTISVCTKVRNPNPILVYFDTLDMKDLKKYDFTSKLDIKTLSNNCCDTSKENSRLFSAQKLSFNEANELLNKDNNIIVSYDNEPVCKLVSGNMFYKELTRNDNPNYYHRFIELLNKIYSPMAKNKRNIDKYIQSLIDNHIVLLIDPKETVKFVKEGISLENMSSNDETIFSIKSWLFNGDLHTNVMKIVANIMIYCSPIYICDDIVSYPSLLLSHINMIVSLLNDKSYTPLDSDVKKSFNRIRAWNDKFYLTAKQNNTMFNRNGKPIPDYIFRNNHLSSTLKCEWPYTLYSMIKLVI